MQIHILFWSLEFYIWGGGQGGTLSHPTFSQLPGLPDPVLAVRPLIVIVLNLINFSRNHINLFWYLWNWVLVFVLRKRYKYLSRNQRMSFSTLWWILYLLKVWWLSCLLCHSWAVNINSSAIGFCKHSILGCDFKLMWFNHDNFLAKQYCAMLWSCYVSSCMDQLIITKFLSCPSPIIRISDFLTKQHIIDMI